MFFSKTPILIHVTGCLKSHLPAHVSCSVSRDKISVDRSSEAWYLQQSCETAWNPHHPPSEPRGKILFLPFFCLENQSCLAQSGILSYGGVLQPKHGYEMLIGGNWNDWGDVFGINERSCGVTQVADSDVSLVKPLKHRKTKGLGEVEWKNTPKFANFVKWKLWSWKRTRFVS